MCWWRSSERVALAVAVLCCALFTEAGALAHGGFFRVHEIVLAPDDPDFMVLRSDVWGTALTQDGGETWSWLCAEAYGLVSADPRRTTMLIGDDRRILAASFGEGLLGSQGDLCVWEPLPEFEGELVFDLTRLEDGRLLALSYSTDEQGEKHTRLWVSEDGGASFQPHGEEVPGIGGVSVAVAKSDPDRIYVAAKGTETVQVARTADGGESWELSSISVAVDALNFEPRVAVDPNQPDRVYLLLDAVGFNGSQAAPDSLLASDDGGMIFRTLLSSTSDLPALAFSPDGSRLAVGGIEAGLLVADADAAAGGDESVFEQHWEGEIYGLLWTDEALYAGGDDWNQDPLFSLGRSTDEGTSFEPMFTVCSVVPLECESETRVGRFCPRQFTDMGMGEGNFKEDILDSGRCTSGAMPADAGAAEDGGGGGVAPPPDAGGGGGVPASDASVVAPDSGAGDGGDGGDGGSSGCSCRASSSGFASDAWCFLLATAWLLLRRRRTPDPPGPRVRG